MNGKTLLAIMLPATKKTYDFWVPSDMTLHDATLLITEALESREKHFFAPDAHNTFMAQDTGELLDHNHTIESLGLINGSRLVLV